MRQTTFNTEELRAHWQAETYFHAESAIFGYPDNAFTSVPCFSQREIADMLRLPGWLPGAALHYRDLCFIHTDSKGIWYIYRGKTCLNMLSLPGIIADGQLPGLIDYLLTTPEKKLAKQEFPFAKSNHQQF